VVSGAEFSSGSALAARGTTRLASWICRNLKTELESMKSHRNVVDEFRRAIFVDKDRAPKGWSKLVMPVVAEFQRKSASIEEREEWDRVAQRLVTRYVDREVGGTYH
jgi:hypothetical protein